MLSFAPSAAAVWHCDRVRITCERNSVRHSVFFKRWAGQCVSIIHEVEFKADATAATHEQMQKIIKKEKATKKRIENLQKLSTIRRSCTSRAEVAQPETSRGGCWGSARREVPLYGNLPMASLPHRNVRRGELPLGIACREAPFVGSSPMASLPHLKSSTFELRLVIASLPCSSGNTRRRQS